jgi:hypothetical protein
MTDCFGSSMDTSCYVPEQNLVPLDEMNPPLTGLNGRALHFARMSLTAQYDGLDSGNDDLLNRIIWFATKGTVPYPAKYTGSDEDD